LKISNTIDKFCILYHIIKFKEVIVCQTKEIVDVAYGCGNNNGGLFGGCGDDCSILFFIIIFLLLFTNCGCNRGCGC